VTITWLGVKAYAGPGSPSNTFQVVFEHTHDGNFEIDLIYQQIQWTNGGFGVAQAGITNGGTIDYVLAGSGNSTALTGYPNATLDPNDPNGVWSTRFLNGNPVCFVAGTRIATPDGWREVQDLRAGDLVETLDDGPQPLVWTGGGSVMAMNAALPVCIAAGALGNERAFRLSGQHMLMVAGAASELLFGEGEVLVAARDLVGLAGITQQATPELVRYHHLMTARHQLIRAEGAVAETLFPGPPALADLPHRARAGLLADAGPAVQTLLHSQAVRRVLKAHEARVLVARMHGAPVVPLRRPAKGGARQVPRGLARVVGSA